MAFQRTPIASGWQFKNAKDPDSSFLGVAQFPTNIHLDLLKHSKIVDPFLDTNEDAVQWVGEETWDYQTTFPTPSDGVAGRAELVFEGLDTHATVSLNGTEILKTDNMFIHHRADVTGKLNKAGGEGNVLKIRFDSTWIVGKKMEMEATDKPLFCHNGDSSRLQVRKAQYHYGWDWGPTLLTCGPWRPIYLETFTGRVKHLKVKHAVSDSLNEVSITASAEVDGSSGDRVSFELFDNDEKPVGKQDEQVNGGVASVSFSVSDPALWFPRGHGSQPLYTVKATLQSSSQVLSTSSKRIGLRKVELVQRPLVDNKPGTTFFFRINGVPVFCCGADWIPADSFLSRITADRYRDWVRFAAEGNHNMIRVWGGGVFEDDSFYAAADEMGVMIWHDFMLGCGAYPVTQEFLAQIEAETVFNIRLLEHHPCIVLWCGNNEDHMFADRYPSGYDPDDPEPANWLKTRWPARIIYDKILPELCAAHCPEIPYHPGSPWGGRPSNDPAAGDVHAWGVWMKALEMYPYQYYPRLAGRFVSEFGVKSYPDLRTLEAALTDPAERHPQSRGMDAHGKGASKTPWAPDSRHVALYMFENLRAGRTLPLYVYASQLVQAEAMSVAYVSWRRLWRGEGREECAGALCWQLNDCWPCVSWSLGDYYLRPKLAYFTVKRALTPLAVGASREEVETGRRDPLTRVHVQKDTRLQVWAASFAAAPSTVDLEVRAVEIGTGETLWRHADPGVKLAANQSTELVDIPFPTRAETQGRVVVAVRLLDPETGATAARYADWPQPLRHIDLPRPEVQIAVDGDVVRVSAPLPVKALQLSLESGEEVTFDDNCVDVIPGDEQIIRVPGLKGRRVKGLHLGIAADE